MTQPPNEPPQNGDGAPPPSPFSKAPEPGPNQAPAPQPPQGAPGQPPQTPPPAAGGFGAPTQPPAGGFGAPTPPGQQPTQPGYGYPQAPGQAPGQPPQAPGQPPQTPPPGQAPPAGYGYPGQPGQQPQQPGQQPQPGYGFPGQPGQPGAPAPGQQPGGQPTYGMYPPQAPAPQQPGGNGGGLTNQLKIIIAAVAAVVLIVGAGVVYKATSGDDTTDVAGNSSGDKGGGQATGGKAPDGPGKEQVPASSASKVKFQLPYPTVADVTTVKGTWITEKVFAKALVNSVVGYDAGKGTQLWKLDFPGAVCGYSRWLTADSGKGAVLFEGPKEPGKKYAQCTQVGLIDLNAGKLLWQKNFKEGDSTVRLENVTVSGNTVAVGSLSGGGAFDLTGKELWSPKPTADQCEDKGYAGGPDGLVALRYCGDYDSPQILVQTLNPTTGAPLSTFKMPTGADKAAVLSVKPLVVSADVGDTAEGTSGMSDIFSVDAKTGKQLAKIAVDGEKYEPRCRFDDIENCTQVVVGNNKVYLPTAQHQGKAEVGRTNEIVSFDLTTGKPTSDRIDAGEGYSMYPLRMDGGNLIVYKTPPYDKGGRVTSIEGSTLKQTVLLENPADRTVTNTERDFTFDMKAVKFEHGRLYLSKDMVSKPSSISEKKYLAVVFGTD
ncbi:PQQ-binding-like beta-propeller repeat protein [Streptomyces sp. NPDC021093]|uniref:outer membrane protein assembly factor BamB family protein n=1 Tax=Streptomyces sp. NPDC021093 TaxID=3365112 RepID=UPI0037AD79C1